MHVQTHSGMRRINSKRPFVEDVGVSACPLLFTVFNIAIAGQILLPRSTSAFNSWHV